MYNQRPQVAIIDTIYAAICAINCVCLYVCYRTYTHACKRNNCMVSSLSVDKCNKLLNDGLIRRYRIDGVFMSGKRKMEEKRSTLLWQSLPAVDIPSVCAYVCVRVRLIYHAIVVDRL